MTSRANPGGLSHRRCLVGPGALAAPGLPTCARAAGRWAEKLVALRGREPSGAIGGSIFPTNLPYEKWGAIRSYLEFPNHLIDTSGFQGS